MFRVSGLGLAVCRFRGGRLKQQCLGHRKLETSWVSLRSVQAVAAGTVTVWVEKSGVGGGGGGAQKTGAGC